MHSAAAALGLLAVQRGGGLAAAAGAGLGRQGRQGRQGGCPRRGLKPTADGLCGIRRGSDEALPRLRADGPILAAIGLPEQRRALVTTTRAAPCRNLREQEAPALAAVVAPAAAGATGACRVGRQGVARRINAPAPELHCLVAGGAGRRAAGQRGAGRSQRAGRASAQATAGGTLRPSGRRASANAYALQSLARAGFRSLRRLHTAGTHAAGTNALEWLARSHPQTELW